MEHLPLTSVLRWDLSTSQEIPQPMGNASGCIYGAPAENIFVEASHQESLYVIL